MGTGTGFREIFNIIKAILFRNSVVLLFVISFDIFFFSTQKKVYKRKTLNIKIQEKANEK